MVSDFVNDGGCDPSPELITVGGDTEVRTPEDGDPIRHSALVRHGTSAGQAHTLVEAEQHALVALLLAAIRPVLDLYRNVLDVVGEFLWDGFERFGDQILEVVERQIHRHGEEDRGRPDLLRRA